jgi:hypothetical protein
MHFSPMAWHIPGAFAHRATPSGPAMHTPEQQLAAFAQRSPSGLQPGTAAQREATPAVAGQRPEQQSMSFMQISKAT